MQPKENATTDSGLVKNLQTRLAELETEKKTLAGRADQLRKSKTRRERELVHWKGVAGGSGLLGVLALAAVFAIGAPQKAAAQVVAVAHHEAEVSACAEAAIDEASFHFNECFASVVIPIEAGGAVIDGSWIIDPVCIDGESGNGRAFNAFFGQHIGDDAVAFGNVNHAAHHAAHAADYGIVFNGHTISHEASIGAAYNGAHHGVAYGNGHPDECNASHHGDIDAAGGQCFNGSAAIHPSHSARPFQDAIACSPRIHEGDNQARAAACHRADAAGSFHGHRGVADEDHPVYAAAFGDSIHRHPASDAASIA